MGDECISAWTKSWRPSPWHRSSESHGSDGSPASGSGAWLRQLQLVLTASIIADARTAPQPNQRTLMWARELLKIEDTLANHHLAKPNPE